MTTKADFELLVRHQEWMTLDNIAAFLLEQEHWDADNEDFLDLYLATVDYLDAYLTLPPALQRLVRRQ